MEVSAPPRPARESQQMGRDRGGAAETSMPPYHLLSLAGRGGAETSIWAKNIEESSEFIQISFADSVWCPSWTL